MHRNRNPCNSFLMVKMASGMDHRHMGPTTQVFFAALFCLLTEEDKQYTENLTAKLQN